MKKTLKALKKLLVCILICLMINNFFFSNITLAADDDGFVEWLEGMLGSVVGLLTWPIRMVALACAWAIDGVTQQVAFSQGAVDETGKIVEGTYYNIEMLTPFDIFFNRIALLDVNFFNILDDGTIISNMRNSIAGWYYVMRMIAASILLCILIYVGIRMAITTIASDKAAYKKMLVDWVCSLALIFLLQYIILFTFSVNEAFINALSGITDATALSDAMVNIKKLSTGISVNSIAATIVFCMLTIQTLGLLISYVNRMLKIAFLVIISPLITLTYSIDKMGDGKAQALGTWLKEFIYTVLLQTFHCIIYIAFVGMALSILNSPTLSDENTLAGVVLAILCVKFTKDAEKILGKIFDFSGSTSDSSLAVGMAASAMALSKAKGIGKGARSAVNGVKNLNIGGRVRTAKVETLAMASVLKGKTNANGEKMTWEEAKDDANSQVTAKEAAKDEKKNSRKYGVSTKDKGYQKEVSQVANELMKNTGMTKQLAFATARAQVAKNKRREAKDSKHPNIAKARGTVGKFNQARKILANSETGKAIKSIVNSQVSAGIGTFVGAGTYGATGNAFNAIALGAASYKGTQEFFKASSGTLVDTSQKLLKGFGITNQAQAENELKTTRAMAPILSDNTELQRQLDELLKFVEEALGKGEESKDAKATIKNTVAKSIKEDPEISNEALMRKVMGELKGRKSLQIDKFKDEKGNDATGFQLLSKSTDLKSGINSVSDMQRRKELYDTIQGAGNIGLTEDTFTRMAAREFPDKSPETVNDAAFMEAMRNNGKLNDEYIEKITEEKTGKELGQLRDQLNAEREKLLSECQDIMDYDPEGADELQRKSDNLESSIANIEDCKKRQIESVIADYQRQFETAKAELEATATAEAQKKFDEEVSKMRSELEEYKKDIERFAGKDKTVRAAYTSGIDDTLKNMDGE